MFTEDKFADNKKDHPFIIMEFNEFKAIGHKERNEAMMRVMHEHLDSDSVTAEYDSYFAEVEIIASSVLEKKLEHEFEIAKLREEKLFFRQKKEGLMNDPNFNGKFVAVINNNVVDTDGDKSTLMKRVYAKHGYITILIEKIGEESIATIHSPHIQK